MQDRISDEKIQIVRNLFLLGILEEFIAPGLDLEILVVIRILIEAGGYRQATQ